MGKERTEGERPENGAPERDGREPETKRIPPDLAALTTDERMKYEIARELGLDRKVEESGWKSLTAKESGRIGGLMTRRKKELAKQEPIKREPIKQEPAKQEPEDTEK